MLERQELDDVFTYVEPDSDKGADVLMPRSKIQPG